MRIPTPLRRSWARWFSATGLAAAITLLCGVGVGRAQTTGKISGTVTDAGTGEPLPGVNVVIEGTQQGTATDAEGYYVILNVAPGTYDLRASFIGYQTLTKTGVEVTVDHNTVVDYALEPATAELQEVTVRAEREVVKMDMSASAVSIQAQDVQNIPSVKDFGEFLNLQGGIEGMSVRGGGLDEVDFMVDGLTMVDNRANTPLTNMVNLSAIQGAEIIKGGFNAEYGNVRSGVISVVTKDGDPNRYSGMFDMRVSPPRIKHSGTPLYDPMSYYLRPYFDDEVAWEGTGVWPEELQEQYPDFIGWNAVAERLNNDEDPSNDMTPEEAQQKFLWETAAEGSAALGQRENLYGNLWDWRIDGSLGGPVPVIGRYLGNMTFFASHKTNREEFGLPAGERPYFTDQNTMLKLTSRVTPRLKISAEGTFGNIYSIVRSPRAVRRINDYNQSATDVFDTRLIDAGTDHYSLYNPGGMNLANIYMNMQGINIDHTLSDRTFYKVRLSRSHVKNDVGRHQGYRDTTVVRCFGEQCVDERPWGLDVGTPYSNQAGFNLAGTHGDPFDFSTTTTYNLKFDITSQIGKYNLGKTGVEVNYDRLNTFHKEIREYVSHEEIEKWEAPPVRIGGYVQDKFEWKGMIANVGVRLDYYSPNTDWYFLDDPYSNYYSSEFATNFTEAVPRSATKAHTKISPRLGVSHPITSVSKLYFNYGHFYSVAPAQYRYRIRHPGYESALDYLGNPNLDLPRTVAYELGYEHQVGSVLVHVSGYYKDVTRQVARIDYTNYDASVDYSTFENNNYQDIRGFEIRLEKDIGRWVTGWVNYNYMVETSGYIGRQHYYQDQRLQRLQGLQNPYQEKPLARPYARALVSLHTPEGWGPELAGARPLSDWRLNFIYQYKAGRYFTWDPLDTDELQDNVQWAPYHNWDVRISKGINFGSTYGISLYADVQNLFNQKHLSDVAFEQGADFEEYMRSLHLPMYEDEIYQAEGLTAGDDRPGDIKSDGRSYIDMPDRSFLWYLDERYVEFGAVINF